MNLQMRLEIQAAVQQWMESFMQQYNVPAYAMEDAMNKALSNLKDKVMVEFLTAAAMQQQQQSQAPQEGEENDSEEAGD